MTVVVGGFVKTRRGDQVAPPPLRLLLLRLRFGVAALLAPAAVLVPVSRLLTAALFRHMRDSSRPTISQFWLLSVDDSLPEACVSKQPTPHIEAVRPDGPVGSACVLQASSVVTRGGRVSARLLLFSYAASGIVRSRLRASDRRASIVRSAWSCDTRACDAGPFTAT